jgi:HAD superfamily hydrolase (TIGR01509 family)
MTKVRGVILDVDGTLIDSNDAHAHAWVDALHEFDYDISFERVRHLVGMGGDNLLPSVIHVEAESPRGKEITQKRDAVFKSHYFPTLRAFPQVRALVERMQQDGLRIAIASSGEKEDVQKLLELAQVDDLIETLVSSADVEKSKPNPDVVQVALQRLGFEPSEVIMIGDSPYDVQAAGKAYVAVIALRCGGFSDLDLKDAIAIYDDPSDLLANYKTSPLAAKQT